MVSSAGKNGGWGVIRYCISSFLFGRFPLLGRRGVGCLSMHLAPIYVCMEIFKSQKGGHVFGKCIL